MNPWTISFEISGHIHIYPPEPNNVPGTGTITFTTEKGSHMGEITVQSDETTLRATVEFTDKEGNPTTPDDIPVWAVGDPTVLTCTPAADGLSATFGVGNIGASAVTVTTIETHEGVGNPTTVLLSGLVTVVAADVVAGSIDFETG